MTKTCTICSVEKSVSEFGRHGARIYNQCKACKVKQAKERRLADPKTFNKKRRGFYVRHRAKLIKDAAQWRASHRESVKRTNAAYEPKRDPVKQKARRLLKQAVRRGRIVKPPHCEGCAATTPKSKLHGHHKDYSKPFVVEWFCNDCHAKHHRLERNS